MSVGAAGACLSIALASLSGGWHSGRAYEAWATVPKLPVCSCQCSAPTSTCCHEAAPAPAAPEAEPEDRGNATSWIHSLWALFGQIVQFALYAAVALGASFLTACWRWVRGPQLALTDSPRPPAAVRGRDRALAHLAVDASAL